MLAIQTSEAEQFRKATRQQVETLGHYLPDNFQPAKILSGPRHKKGEKFRVGYLGSSNPINQHSLFHFSNALKKRPALMRSFSFHLAGAICDSDTAQSSPFEKLGFVESAASFYRDMDIILNPNVGGTGLKIKSVEALSYGKPLVATADAMVGIETAEPFHHCSDIDALADALGELADDPDEIIRLGAAGQDIFAAYSGAQAETLDKLFPGASAEQIALSGFQEQAPS